MVNGNLSNGSTVASCWQTEGRTDRHKDANCLFSHFCEGAFKKINDFILWLKWLSILLEKAMWNLRVEVTLRHSTSKNHCSFLNNEMKIYKWPRFRHILLFGMLDTSLIFTPFNPLSSHNVVHKCEHATFNVDCCYGILQLIRCLYAG
jgi:hypothetical protein